MMPSLYSGVSGLRNHNTRMNVIANNIANVNTNGFKYGRVTFQDMLSMDLSGAAAPTDRKGGVNPKQYGLGMTIAAVDNIFTQGSLQTTGKVTDVAITGDGFFVLRKGDQTVYTRSGAFDVDRDGTLVNPANGLKVQGWTAVTDNQGNARIDTSGTIGDLNIPVYGKQQAKATTEVDFKSNLNSQLPVLGADATPEQIAANSVVTTIDVYDSDGNVHELRTTMWRTGLNQWNARPLVYTKDANGQETQVPATLNIPAAGNVQNPGNTLQLNFDNQGSLISIANSDGSNPLTATAPGAVLDLVGQLGFTVPGTNPQTINLNLGTAGRYNGITQFASPSTTRAYKQDGYNMGYLESFIIDDNGVITGSYTNGQKRELGQIALSVFTNPGGLKKVGENYWEETNNSGLHNIGEPETAGRGKINSGKLEMSNVDLAEQFTDMIITERGFQANSRSITTSDQMLQELLSLKR